MSFNGSILVNPTRNSIIIFFADSSGNPADLQSIATNPTLTTQSLNGGAPFSLTDPIWGITQPAYQSWLYYTLPGTIGTSDTPVLSAPASWATTTAGAVAALSAYPVDNSARSTLLPPFVEAQKTMRVGYNCRSPFYYSTVPIYSNLARQIQGWGAGGGSTFSQDATTRMPLQVSAGGALQALVLTPNQDRTTNDRGTASAPPSGVWTLMWDGQAVDPGAGNRPIMTLDSAGLSGESITPVGIDSLTGTNNKRQFQVTQDQSYWWSPGMYVLLHGRTDGAAFDPPLANLRVYPPDPANTNRSLTDASPKFHPSYLNMLAGVKCLRFSLGASSGDVTDFSDFLPVQAIGYSMPVRSYGGTISRVDPYTDTEGYFGNAATALLTFSAPHNIKDGNSFAPHIPGPNTDQSFPLTASAPNNVGYMLDYGNYAVSGIVRYNPATMLDTQVVFVLQTPSALVAPCTLTQSWNVPSPGDWYCYGSTNPGMPPSECIDLANTVGADLWLSLSYNATDSCVQSLADLVAQRLAAGHKFYFEYDNEDWNFGFFGWHYMACNARSHGFGGWSDYYTYRAGQIHALALSAFQANSPARGDDLVRVFGAQGSWAGGSTQYIAAFAAAHSIPIDVIAVAPYFENSVSPDVGPGGGEWSLATAYDACDADQIMDLGELFIQYGGYEHDIKDHYQYVGPSTPFPNTRVVCYEGGPEKGLPATALSDGVMTERYEIWARHPRMRGIMLYFLQMLQDNGCDLFNNFLVSDAAQFATQHANWNAYYTWNMKPGKGDGSDGLGDNRLFAAPAAVPFQDYNRLVSVVGGAINHWNFLTSIRPSIGQDHLGLFNGMDYNQSSLPGPSSRPIGIVGFNGMLFDQSYYFVSNFLFNGTMANLY